MEPSDLSILDQSPSSELEALDLTPLQLQYAYWRGLGLTPRAAAKRAGYSEAAALTGGSVVKNIERSTKVRKAISLLQEQTRLKYNIDRDAVVSGLMEAINVAREQSDAAAMVKGWSEMIKLTGVAEPKRTEIEVRSSPTENLLAASNKDLLKLLGKQRVLGSVIDAEFVEMDTSQ